MNLSAAVSSSTSRSILPLQDCCGWSSTQPRSKGSWPQLTSLFWRCSLSMNQPARSADFCLKNHIVFAREFLQETHFRLGNFLFVFLKSVFHIPDPVNHQAPVQFSQLARQRQIGHQSSLATLDSAIESAQGFVHATTHTAGNDAEQAAGPITRTALAGSAFSTISTARRQPRPSSE